MLRKLFATGLLIALPMASGSFAAGIAVSGTASVQQDEAITLASDATDRILVNRNQEGVALEGYDPVAYFTDNKPVMGDPQLRAGYRGAIYQFASAKHKAMFEADPAHYAPQYGGFCAYAASINKLAPIDPTVFQITNDRLLLQHSPEAYKLFNKDTRMSLASADKNWPGLVERNGH